MKSKDQKRKEAIERNLRRMSNKYVDKDLKTCRSMLGIPVSDASYDTMIRDKQKELKEVQDYIDRQKTQRGEDEKYGLT